MKKTSKALLSAAIFFACQNTLANDVEGAWGPLIDFPIEPIHNVVMPDGRVMLFGTNSAPGSTAGNPAHLDYVIWDPSLGTGPASIKVLDNPTVTDIFCAGQIVLPATGEVFTAGGDNAGPGTWGNADTTIFDPKNETMVNDATMTVIRWYPTLITLPNGELLIQGGSLYGGELGQPVVTPEVYTPGTGWRTLLGATSHFAYGGAQNKWWYPRSWVLSDGRVFGLSGSSMFYVDTEGAGALTEAGTFPTNNIGATSTAVMYGKDKVLQMGGGNYAAFGGGAASPYASMVDLSGPTPVVTQASQPQYARHWANSVLLADGQVMLSGGSLLSNSLGQGFYDTPEVWNPETDTWTPMAPEGVFRLYHSSTILLPDGTVFSNGGGDPGPAQQRNGKIFYPPYLFNGTDLAPRPTYELEGEQFGYGNQMNITFAGPNPIERAVLIKTSAVTHSFNVEQRIIELDVSITGNVLSTQMPISANEATPGFYMLFLIDSEGTPSVADIVQLNHGTYTQPTINLLQDGGFETLTPAAGGYLSFPTSASLGPWTIGGTGIDLHENTHRGLGFGGGNGGAEGNTHIDLRGSAGGSVSQTISGLVPGVTYKVTFKHAVHDLAAGSATANVSIANLDATFTSTKVGSSEWTQASYSFIADSATETLTFSGVSSVGYPYTGVLLDDVTVSAFGGVVDGGFETLNPPAGGWIGVPAGESIGPWIVGGSGVDLHENTHRGLGLGAGGAEGKAHVDLRGTTSGSVSQPINGLVPGKTYLLSFDHAIHDAANGSAIASVSIGGLGETFTSTIVGSTEWTSAAYLFTATSTTETLTFSGISSAGNPYTGVLIDSVAIAEYSVSLQDGGFETLTAPVGGWIGITPGESIGPWLVGGSGVDLHENTHRGLGLGGSNGGAKGQNHVDLRGTAGGSVSQTISGLVPGKSYVITFDHAIHDLANGSATANISIANVNETFTSTTAGSTDWTATSYVFTATSATETLTFTGVSSAGNPYTGILIDDVSVKQ